MSLIEKVDKLEQVAKLYLKGYNYSEIGRELGITQVMAKNYVNEYKEYVRGRAESDPDLLDRLQENTLQALDEINMIYKETWQVYESAREYEAMNHQVSSLKLLSEISEKKAKLLQLMGAKTDSSAMARMQRAEQVNEIVSGVLKDVVRDCPRCNAEVRIKLAQAFEIMGKAEDMADPQEIEDAEIIQES